MNARIPLTLFQEVVEVCVSKLLFQYCYLVQLPNKKLFNSCPLSTAVILNNYSINHVRSTVYIILASAFFMICLFNMSTILYHLFVYTLPPLYCKYAQYCSGLSGIILLTFEMSYFN